MFGSVGSGRVKPDSQPPILRSHPVSTTRPYSRGAGMRGPSIPAPLEYGRVVDTGWDRRMGGCESGFTLPDPTDPNIVWASCYGNEVTRWDARTKRARSVSPWIHTLDSPPNELKYRCHWTPPLAIDPFDHNTVYYGFQC